MFFGRKRAIIAIRWKCGAIRGVTGVNRGFCKAKGERFMKISEVSKLTGLSISNIRFYEKKGLLAPLRNEDNQYREYDEEDLLRLKQIILYRKMDLSVETIEGLQKGEIELNQTLSEHKEALFEQQDRLQGTVDLCEAVLSRGFDDDLDVDYYLEYIKVEEAAGRKFNSIDDVLSDYGSMCRVGIDQIIPDFYLGRLNVGKVLRILLGIFVLAMPVAYLVSLAGATAVAPAESAIKMMFLIVLCWGSFVEFYLRFRHS